MKVFFAKLSVLTSMLLLYGATSVWAQGKGKISFSGTVQASETEGGGNSKITPLAYAVVSLPEIGVATTPTSKAGSKSNSPIRGNTRSRSAPWVTSRCLRPSSFPHGTRSNSP